MYLANLGSGSNSVFIFNLHKTFSLYLPGTYCNPASTVTSRVNRVTLEPQRPNRVDEVASLPLTAKVHVDVSYNVRRIYQEVSFNNCALSICERRGN
jgi:hypothetical protein